MKTKGEWIWSLAILAGTGIAFMAVLRHNWYAVDSVFIFFLFLGFSWWGFRLWRQHQREIGGKKFMLGVMTILVAIACLVLLVAAIWPNGT